MMSNYTTPAADSTIEGSIVSHSEDRALPACKSTSAVNSLLSAPSEHLSEEVECKGEVLVRRKISRLLQGKEEEWTAVATKSGPLQLLDLPMDILKEIVKEVMHTISQ